MSYYAVSKRCLLREVPVLLYTAPFGVEEEIEDPMPSAHR